MIPLILSIFSSTIILVIFKLFQKLNINTFQAIVFNYFTASLIGFAFYLKPTQINLTNDLYWLPGVIMCALLFIGLFFLIGKSSQINGIASTSISVKMSLVIPITLMILIYLEKLSIFKVIGISLAFIGILLISLPNAKKQENKAKWMLIVLFIGSGLLDFTLNFIQKNILHSMDLSIFTSISLGTAGIIGCFILIKQGAKRSMKIKLKNILAGIILGIPNYFSIYLLLLSYRSTQWEDSTVLAITNVSVIICSAMIGFIVFKERKTNKKIIGLLAAILAIITLCFEN